MDDERPPSATGALVLVALAFLVFVVVLGVWAFGTITIGRRPVAAKVAVAQVVAVDEHDVGLFREPSMPPCWGMGAPLAPLDQP